jgi:hypothetical protein
VGRAIELRKTLIGALNSISQEEGNTSGCDSFIPDNMPVYPGALPKTPHYVH